MGGRNGAVCVSMGYIILFLHSYCIFVDGIPMSTRDD